MLNTVRVSIIGNIFKWKSTKVAVFAVVFYKSIAHVLYFALTDYNINSETTKSVVLQMDYLRGDFLTNSQQTSQFRLSV